MFNSRGWIERAAKIALKGIIMAASSPDTLSFGMWIIGGIGVVIFGLLMFILKEIIQAKTNIGVLMTKVATLFRQKLDQADAERVVNQKMISLLSDYRKGQGEIISELSKVTESVNKLNTLTAVLQERSNHNQ